MNLPPKKDLENKELVGISVLSFLNEDTFVKGLKSDYMQRLADAGLLNTFSKVFFKEEAITTNLVPFFMQRVFIDASQLKNKDQKSWKDFLDLLSKLDANVLESNYKIAQKHKIKTNQLSNFDFLNNLQDENSKSFYIANIFFDALLHSEIIILSNYYFEYFKEKYIPES